mmetsp:Transcript_24798/g.40653  ORF Transcript_24798/g.40653 Transcript_24798/m.40653 type:complete len:276 (-) Transcript_24798:198-1025(-)
MTENPTENNNVINEIIERCDSSTTDSSNAIDETPTRNNIQQQASLYMLDDDDADFDGGGEQGAFGDFNNLQDPDGVEKSEDSNSSIENGRDRRRKAKRVTSSNETKKKKRRGNEKDEKSSDAAKKREFDKFTRWLSDQPKGIPTEWSNSAPEKIEGDEFIQFASRMIEKARGLGMKDNVATRVQHVLDNSPGKTYAELFESTLMCFVPIKGGSRKTRYEIKHCKVCKAAGELIDQRDHSCPYCHDCFNESRWKKKYVLVEKCTEKHVKVASVSTA